MLIAEGLIPLFNGAYLHVLFSIAGASHSVLTPYQPTLRRCIGVS